MRTKGKDISLVDLEEVLFSFGEENRKYIIAAFDIIEGKIYQKFQKLEDNIERSSPKWELVRCLLEYSIEEPNKYRVIEGYYLDVFNTFSLNGQNFLRNIFSLIPCSDIQKIPVQRNKRPLAARRFVGNEGLPEKKQKKI